MDCSPLGSSVHGILQARILEWVAIPFSRGSAWPRDKPRSPALQVDSLQSEPPGIQFLKAQHVGHSWEDECPCQETVLNPESAFQDTASSLEGTSGRHLILCTSNQQCMEVTPAFHGRASPLNKSTGSFRCELGHERHFPSLPGSWQGKVRSQWRLWWTEMKAWSTRSCVLSTIYISGPQPLWHQGSVLWKMIFPWTGGGGMVSGWFKCIIFIVHFISNLMLLLIWWEVLVCMSEFGYPWSILYTNGSEWTYIPSKTKRGSQFGSHRQYSCDAGPSKRRQKQSEGLGFSSCRTEGDIYGSGSQPRGQWILKALPVPGQEESRAVFPEASLDTLLQLLALHQSAQDHAHPPYLLYPEPTGKGRCPAASTYCAWSVEANAIMWDTNWCFIHFFPNRLPGLGSLLDQCWPLMERREQSLPCFLYQYHPSLWFCPLSMHSSTCYKIITKTLLWRRKWQSTPGFLPGKSHGQRSLADSSPQGCKELDMIEWLSLSYGRKESNTT